MKYYTVFDVSQKFMDALGPKDTHRQPKPTAALVVVEPPWTYESIIKMFDDADPLGYKIIPGGPEYRRHLTYEFWAEDQVRREVSDELYADNHQLFVSDLGRKQREGKAAELRNKRITAAMIKAAVKAGGPIDKLLGDVQLSGEETPIYFFMRRNTTTLNSHVMIERYALAWGKLNGITFEKFKMNKFDKWEHIWFPVELVEAIDTFLTETK